MMDRGNDLAENGEEENNTNLKIRGIGKKKGVLFWIEIFYASGLVGFLRWGKGILLMLGCSADVGI